MNEYKSRDIGGVMTPSSMPTSTQGRYAGLHVRAVVLRTRYVDDKSVAQFSAAVPLTRLYPVEAPRPADRPDRRSVVCDVLVYSGLANLKKAVLQDVIVMQVGGGMHTGDIWVPRPTTCDVRQQQAVDFSAGFASIARINPGDLDGDHVIVTFLDDSLSLPVILGTVDHPSADNGNDAKGDSTQNVRLRMPAEGTLNLPRLVKHNGAIFGVNAVGDFIVDTTRAHKGVYDRTGREPRLPGDPADAATTEVPTDGSSGNVDITLRADQTLSVRILTDPADLDGDQEPTLFRVADGVIELRTQDTDPTKIEITPETITIDAQNDQGVVRVKGQTADLAVDEVTLGDGAAHPVVLGDTFNDVHASMLGALKAALTAVSASLGVLAGQPPDPATAAAVVALTAATAAIDQFLADAAGALSVNVKTR